MLTKPSKATNLLDLQEELAKDTAQTIAQGEDTEMKINAVGNGFENQHDMISSLNDELSKVFSNLFK